MKTRIVLLFSLCCLALNAQTTWPAQAWPNAVNLTTVMSNSGITELSGLHWNPENNRLYAVQGDGRLRVLQYDSASQTFTQLANKSLSGGPEGITQRDLAANEFYVVDENNYQIRKFTYTANFASISLAASWNLLAAPSTMTNTGNTGPEGIVFVPDENLAQTGFTSAQTGQPYTSVKGAGGLFFVAHQDGGYIWVFDINPEVSNDFLFVGKYKSARNESCDLAFDRSTNLMYILHNMGSNYLEVTNLAPAPAVGSEPTFQTVAEYFIANPTDGNINVEGFALMPKCGAVTGSAFLCRDVESDESITKRQDVLRQFTSFQPAGTCTGLSVTTQHSNAVSVYPNPVQDVLTLDFGDVAVREISAYDLLGQRLLHLFSDQSKLELNLQSWASGVYVIAYTQAGKTVQVKVVKP